MREITTEGQSPQGGNAAETPLAGMEIASPPISDVWRDHPLHETLPTPACPVSRRDLPTRYEEDYVVLLARDPVWIFAYWEITPQTWSQAREALRDDECQTTLRVYELQPTTEKPLGHFDIPVQPFSQAWHIHTGKQGGSFQVAIGIRTPEGIFREIARSNIIAAPRGAISPIVDTQWLTVEEFYWVSRHPHPGHSPMEWQKGRQGQITALGAYPTSPGMFSPMGASFGVPLPKAEAAAKPGFFLQVQTELILHGQTTPGAEVTVEGMPVALRPDGSFTLRYALPDGTYCLPVKASFPDTTQKCITPVVTRQTERPPGQA